MTRELQQLNDISQKLMTQETISVGQLKDIQADIRDYILCFIDKGTSDHLNAIIQNTCNFIDVVKENEFAKLEKSSEAYIRFGQLEGFIDCSRNILNMHVLKQRELTKVQKLMTQENVQQLMVFVYKKECVRARDIENRCGSYAYRLLRELIQLNLIAKQKDGKATFYSLTSLGTAQVEKHMAKRIANRQTYRYPQFIEAVGPEKRAWEKNYKTVRESVKKMDPVIEGDYIEKY